MPYTTFGNGYDWRGADGRPDFVSIDNTPQGLPQVFQNGFAMGPTNPVDSHVQFAMQTHAGAQPQSAISPAIAAMQSAIPGLQQQFNPTAPTGYGTLGNGQAVFGGNQVATNDPVGYAANLRGRQSERSMGYLTGENAAGTVDSFFQHPAVAGKTPEQIAAMYDSVFGAGRLQKDLLANQLSQQRAAQNPGGYTPVTYRDVNEFQSSRTPEAMKLAGERLQGIQKQYGIPAIELLHSIGANNMANLPEVKDRSGMVTTPARQVRIDPMLQANLRSSANVMFGQGSFPAPNPDELQELAALHAKATGQTPGAMAAPSAVPAPLVDPSMSPFLQSATRAASVIGDASDKWIHRPIIGAGNAIGNLPTWLQNYFARAQNQQLPYTPSFNPVQ